MTTVLVFVVRDGVDDVLDPLQQALFLKVGDDALAGGSSAAAEGPR